MFLGSQLNITLYEALISVLLISVWILIFKGVRFTLTQRVDNLVSFLKQIEKIAIFFIKIRRQESYLLPKIYFLIVRI